MYYSLFGYRGLLLGAKEKSTGKPTEVTVAVASVAHPVRLRVRTTDVSLCNEILVKEQYKWQFPTAPRVIVDAGANIGLTATYFANRYPNTRIISIEPEATNFEMLAKNTAAYSNVTALHAALWIADGDVDLFDPGQGHTTFQVAAGDGVAGGAARTGRGMVRGVTLGTVMREFGIDAIDLLKVDIEGAEKEIFENASAWIGSVNTIAVETHDWLRPGSSASVRAAAKDFPFVEQRGEITFYSRETVGATAPETATRNAHSKPKFPFQIISES